MMNFGSVICLLSNDSYYQLSCSTIISILAKVDALPSAEVRATIGDGDGDADSAQRRLGVSRHVVGTFQCMLVLRTILRNQMIEDGFHIHTNIRISILVDAQSATGMLRKDIHDASLRQSRQLAQNLTRYQMKTTTFRSQCNFYLLYHKS